MLDIHKNARLYNMIAEGEVANLLANYNPDVIMSTIKENIQKRISGVSIMSVPNIVYSYEQNFKQMEILYPADKENINQGRREVYTEIINAICSSFGLQISENAEDNFDLFYIAYHLYAIFISDYSNIITNFFASFILTNKEMLYNNLELYKNKKDRDSATLYIKRAYDDPALAAIISKINEVVYYISGMDIDLYTLLSYTYDRTTCEFVNSVIVPTHNIFKDEFCKGAGKVSILTDIRLKIQQMYDMIIQSQQQVSNNSDSSSESQS